MARPAEWKGTCWICGRSILKEEMITEVSKHDLPRLPEPEEQRRRRKLDDLGGIRVWVHEECT